ncbi:MAG: 30S ribosomal protein S17 [Chlorobi bacterium]|nr:30S ribosomal protein S17 [Chlorobiota bacterium]
MTEKNEIQQENQTVQETNKTASPKKRGRRKELVGVVVSNKMDKTVVVKVERRFLHPRYGKTVVRHKKFMAHDENNICEEGDVVRIMETRPLSKRKRWRVVEIVAKVQKLDVEQESTKEPEDLEKP